MMTTVLGTCHHDCPDSCGWVVTVEGDKAVRLRGNAAHPYSRGELCPKVNRFLDRVYHPDRLTTPLIRTGPKGERAFRQATWDEALTLVADRVGGVVAEHGGEAVYQWNGAGTQGLIQMSCLDRRFFARLGATRQSGSLCGATAKTGLALTYGDGRGADPADLRHAEVVLLWGNNTRLTNRHLWPFVEEARANGAQIVVIDPVRTITATEADWFLQPLPGTDDALDARRDPRVHSRRARRPRVRRPVHHRIRRPRRARRHLDTGTSRQGVPGSNPATSNFWPPSTARTIRRSSER